jgi:tetratricopeptide (TPR) repeat protein
MNRLAGGLGVCMLLAACQSGAPSAAVDPTAYGSASDPQGQQAWERAQRALQAGDHAAALPDLKTAVSRCPDLVRAHIAWQDTARLVGGQAQKEMLDFYGALAERTSPVPSYVKARLADTSYAQGVELQKILARDSSFAWAHLSLGRLHRRQGHLLQASESFQSAIAHDGELPEARLERAQVLAELGRFGEAARDYDAYLARVPDDDAALRAYVTLLIYPLGRIDAAMRVLDRLEARHAGDVSVRMDRAAAQWRGGDPRAAAASYLAVLETTPGEARAALNIGLLYYEVLPKNVEERRVFWPKARAAFEMFRRITASQDGHEAFERVIAVPYRLEVIAGLLGADQRASFTLADLSLPAGG